MTDIAAAIGLGQFSKLNDITAQRRKLAKHYFATLDKDFEKQTGAQLPPPEFESTNWHLFQIVLPERITRADFMAKMKPKYWYRLPLRAYPSIQTISCAGFQGRHVPGRRACR